MKKFYFAVLLVAFMSLTACGADRGSDAVQDMDDEEVVAAVEETDGTEARGNQILQRPILKEITDDIDKAEENIAENTDDNADGIAEGKNTENDTSVIDWEWYEKEDIDLSPYGLSEEYKELLKNICWTVKDFTGPEEMDETFWRIFLYNSYGSGWWREKEWVSGESLATYRHNYSYRVSYEEAENYTQLVFGVEWLGIKPAYEDGSEDFQAFYYEDGFYYFFPSDPLDKWYIITDCAINEDNTIYVTVQHRIDGDEIIWETILTLQPADNENGFILTAKQTERISEPQ